MAPPDYLRISNLSLRHAGLRHAGRPVHTQVAPGRSGRLGGRPQGLHAPLGRGRRTEAGHEAAGVTAVDTAATAGRRGP